MGFCTKRMKNPPPPHTHTHKQKTNTKKNPVRNTENITERKCDDNDNNFCPPKRILDMYRSCKKKMIKYKTLSNRIYYCMFCFTFNKIRTWLGRATSIFFQAFFTLNKSTRLEWRFFLSHYRKSGRTFRGQKTAPEDLRVVSRSFTSPRLGPSQRPTRKR